MSSLRARLEKHRSAVSDQLHNSVIPFWMKNSLDREFGGYFNCLDRDGRVYSTHKHVWLQGRQVWMLSKLHNSLHPGQAKSEYLDAAKLGADFLRKYARRGLRVFFELTRQGRPVYLQRKMFSECFYVMALAEYSRASGDASARAEALEIFDAIRLYAKDAQLLGRPVYDTGEPPATTLAVPMILLNLIDEVCDPGSKDFEDLAQWCVRRTLLHVKPDLEMVLETVGDDGALLDSPEGRLLNPGHAIEAGWFLLAYARKSNNAHLAKTAIDMIEWSFETGWDPEHGGIFYFLDREGYSPLQLEWNMKLWWPHCEAMVAYLMAFQHTGDEHFLRQYEKVADWTLAHFPDREHGEWFGYLTRAGEVNQRFKGGPYKGFFHVPRALWLCERLLGQLLEKSG